jgi:hypothetical protein
LRHQALGENGSLAWTVHVRSSAVVARANHAPRILDTFSCGKTLTGAADPGIPSVGGRRASTRNRRPADRRQTIMYDARIRAEDLPGNAWAPYGGLLASEYLTIPGWSDPWRCA